MEINMVQKPISEQESLLIQSHALMECIVKLGRLEEERGEDFDFIRNTVYGQTARIIHDYNGRSVFQGQGSLLAALYLFLIIPIEWRKNKIGDFEKLDFTRAEKIADQVACSIDNKYADSVLVHLRNALSHGRISWDNNCLVFEDREPWARKGETKRHYRGQLSMADVGQIVQALNEAIIHYINSVIGGR